MNENVMGNRLFRGKRPWEYESEEQESVIYVRIFKRSE